MAFLGLCSLVLAITQILVVLNEVRRFAQVRRRGMNTMAEVVRIRSYNSPLSGKANRNPVIRFTTTDKEAVTTELRWGKMGDSSIGNRVEVRYLPGRPKFVNLWDGGFPYSTVIWLLISSAFFIALGVRLLS